MKLSIIPYKYNFFSIILLITTITLSAEPQFDFDLRTYEPPATKYHSLIFMPGYSVYVYNNDRYSYESTDRTWDIMLSLSDRYTIYTPKKDYTLYNSIHYNMSRSKDSDEDLTGPDQEYDEDRDFTNNIMLYSRAYLTRYRNNKTFFELDIKFDNDIDVPKRNRYNLDKQIRWLGDSTYYFSAGENFSESYMVDCNLDADFFIGKGRITDVTYPVAAIHILDDIKSHGKVNPKINKKDIQDLSAYIETMKKRKYFDNRTGRIERIDSICTYLMHNNLIDSLPPIAVMKLLDQYDYTFNQPRSYGMKFGIGPGGGFTVAREKLYDSSVYYSDTTFLTGIDDNMVKEWEIPDNASTSSTSDKLTTLGGEAHLSSFFQWDTPIGMYFQFISEVSGKFGCVFKDSSMADYFFVYDSEKVSFHNPYWEGNCYVKFSYYPHTRTTISLRSSVNYVRHFGYFTREDWQDDSVLKERDIRDLSINTGLTCYYYFSPRISLSLNISYYVSNYYEKYTPDNFYQREYSFRSLGIYGNIMFQIL